MPILQQWESASLFIPPTAGRDVGMPRAATALRPIDESAMVIRRYQYGAPPASATRTLWGLAWRQLQGRGTRRISTQAESYQQ
jgi:hypothetical protein